MKQKTGTIMQNDTLSKKKSAGYMKLAAAIIASGARDNDQSFLNGEWCDTLRYFLKLGSQEGSGMLDGVQTYTKYI